MTGLALVGILFWLGGIYAAYLVGSSAEVRRYRRLMGLDKKTFKRYKEAAAILNDLEFAADIDDQLTILPTGLRERVSEWNADHRKAITG